jgi:hypothetical protein
MTAEKSINTPEAVRGSYRDLQVMHFYIRAVFWDHHETRA